MASATIYDVEMTLSVVDWFYSTSGFDTDSLSSRFMPIDTVTSTYAPQGIQLLNDLVSITLSVDFATTSTSGNVSDDIIVGELAAFHADNVFDVFHINPETGEQENRHWNTAMQLINARYGIRVGDDIIMPRYAAQIRAFKKIALAPHSSSVEID